MIHLFYNFALLFLIVLILWRISVKIKDVSFIDAFWPIGMFLLTLSSYLQLASKNNYALLVAGLTGIWALRLGAHLYFRWRKHGEDKRYKVILGDAMSKNSWSFSKAALIMAWLLQMPLLFIVCLPAQVGVLYSSIETHFGYFAILGAALAIFGIGFESIADWQLEKFKSKAENKGQVMDKGLWRYTRHPNYFGDACTWWGIWLVSLQVGWPAYFTIIGPLFLNFTLVKWSGKALLEKTIGQRRPGYDEYIRKTSGFIPWPPKS